MDFLLKSKSVTEAMTLLTQNMKNLLGKPESTNQWHYQTAHCENIVRKQLSYISISNLNARKYRGKPRPLANIKDGSLFKTC